MKWRELFPPETQALAEHLTLEHVRVLRDGRQMLVSFLADQLFAESEYLQVKKVLQQAFRPVQASL
ncbi:MAG TPA: hypothetical protein PKE04_23490, partial [Clostridia bacterium]|nr:hypothetical protein [Clostridia bacterium]